MIKPMRKENIIVAFLDRLINEFGFTFNYSKFHYICKHEFYSSLHLKNEYGENTVNIVVIANDILNEISFSINYDLRSDGTYWKGKRFDLKLSNVNFMQVENFIKEILK